MNYVKNNTYISLTWAIILVFLVFIFITAPAANILAQGYLEYQIKEGDSLWTIANQFQLSLQEVAKVNNIELDQQLSPGQLIKIPNNEGDISSSSRNISTVTHTVKKGESLWDIAQKYRLSLEHISSVNDLNKTESLSIGQEIKIPIDVTEKEEVKKGEEQPGLFSLNRDKLKSQEMNTSLKQEFRDLVKEVTSTGGEDESLWRITENYQVSLKDFSQRNDLEDSEEFSLRQIIKSSPNSSPGNEGKEENGKKERYEKEPQQNILQSSVGQQLNIPAPEQASEQETGTTPLTQTDNFNDVIHYVRKGETLWQISRKYKVSVPSIASANQISESARLIVGQTLMIPNTRSSSISSCSFVWPLNGPVTSQFGIRTLRGRRDYHTGIDIDAPAGALIKASGNGKVSFSGYINGYGNVVIIDHAGGYSTVYAHSTNNLVKEGQNVKKGDTICKLGSTGNATGSHLHFEIRENGRPVNPLNYLP